MSDEAQRKSYLFYIHQRPPVLAHRMDEGASSLIVMLINWMAATVFGESRKSEREHYINIKEYVANVPPLATQWLQSLSTNKNLLPFFCPDNLLLNLHLLSSSVVKLSFFCCSVNPGLQELLPRDCVWRMNKLIQPLIFSVMFSFLLIAHSWYVRIANALLYHRRHELRAGYTRLEKSCYVTSCFALSFKNLSNRRQFTAQLRKRQIWWNELRLKIPFIKSSSKSQLCQPSS